jgi:FkbM family methyltransferase
LSHKIVVEGIYGPIVIPKFDTIVMPNYLGLDTFKDHDILRLIPENVLDQIIALKINQNYIGTPSDNDIIVKIGEYLDLIEAPVIMDVGANVGSFMMGWNHILNRHCSIHTFEAQRVVFDMLEQTIKLNRYKNVFNNFLAVSDTDNATIAIPKFDYNKAMASGSVEFGDKQNQTLIQDRQPSNDYVKSITLDTYIKNHNITRLDFVKMDIEGFEILALDGFTSIKTLQPVLFIEYDKCGLANVVNHPNLAGYSFKPRRYDLVCYPSNSTDDTIATLERLIQ